jgi:hypothetical protein
VIRRPAIVTALLVGLAVTGCATTQGAFTPLGGQRQPPRYADCKVAVFRGDAPQLTFIRVSRIDVHMERTFWMRPGFSDVVSELRRQACLSGADAVIEIKEEHESIGENRSYHVTGIGVKYSP